MLYFNPWPPCEILMLKIKIIIEKWNQCVACQTAAEMCYKWLDALCFSTGALAKLHKLMLLVFA